MNVPARMLAAALAAVALAVAAGAADRSAPKTREPKPAADSAKAAPAPVSTPSVVPVAPAQEPSGPAVPGPAGKAEVKELVFDAGTVERGAEVIHSFTIKNVGEHDLTVDAKPGCGCTVTEFDKIIAKGATGSVKATVHTVNFKGPITKSITVTTNDPENSKFTLQMKANVTVPVDFQPSENVSFNGKSETFKPQELTMTSASGEPFDVISATPADANFTVTVVADPASGTAPKTKAGTLASGVSRYKITVTPSKSLPVGRISSTVDLKTTHPKAEQQTIRIFGTVTGDVDVVPQYVTLSTGPSAAPEAKVQHVKIKKASGDPLRILSVTCDNPEVATTLKTVTDGREYDLEVKYTGQPMTMALTAKITAKTNDPKQPNLDIQVWGRVDAGMRPAQVGSAAPVRPAVPPPSAKGGATP